MGKVISGLDCVTPFKRRPSRDLPPGQRVYNRVLSRVRIRVENDIQRAKVFWIMKEYMSRLKKYDHINDIVCGRSTRPLLKRGGTL